MRHSETVYPTQESSSRKSQYEGGELCSWPRRPSRWRPCREVRGQRDGFIGIDNGLENSPTAKKKDGNYAPKLKVYKKG